jgi:hypothetical protein
MKLKNIASIWPPVPCETVHFKTVHKSAMERVIIPMDDIHAPGWWTGLRIVTQSPGGYIVELMTNEGTPLSIGENRWIQDAGSWMPLPWPIPAQMARATGLRICLRPAVDAGAVAEPLWVKYELSVHDLDEEPADGRYAFLGCDRRLAMHWNGPLNGGGSMSAALPLHHDIPHRVVHRTPHLLNQNPRVEQMETIIPVGWDVVYSA